MVLFILLREVVCFVLFCIKYWSLSSFTLRYLATFLSILFLKVLVPSAPSSLSIHLSETYAFNFTRNQDPYMSYFKFMIHNVFHTNPQLHIPCLEPRETSQRNAPGHFLRGSRFLLWCTCKWLPTVSISTTSVLQNSHLQNWWIFFKAYIVKNMKDGRQRNFKKYTKLQPTKNRKMWAPYMHQAVALLVLALGG